MHCAGSRRRWRRASGSTAARSVCASKRACRCPTCGDLGARDRAVTLFGKLRVWDTEHNNGVLIYVLLADRAIEVVADRGLMRHVDATQWQALVQRMRDAFRAGHIEQGLVQAVDTIGALLAQHFPLADGSANPNELPDRVDLR